MYAPARLRKEDHTRNRRGKVRSRRNGTPRICGACGGAESGAPRKARGKAGGGTGGDAGTSPLKARKGRISDGRKGICEKNAARRRRGRHPDRARRSGNERVRGARTDGGIPSCARADRRRAVRRRVGRSDAACGGKCASEEKARTPEKSQDGERTNRARQCGKYGQCGSLQRDCGKGGGEQ